MSVFKMPVPVKITGRTSTISNAFVSSIVPVIEPTPEEVIEALQTLEMTDDNIECIYCGSRYSEWDHLNPLVKDGEPTGYISEIANLVPACGKCNQSKGNKNWKTWMQSSAKLSPKTKGVQDLERRIRLLEQYERLHKVRYFNFSEISGELWEVHQNNKKLLFNLMRNSQDNAEKIKVKIEKFLHNQNAN